MSNNIRVYSLDADDKTSVGLRTLRHDDMEVVEWRRPKGQVGAMVVDIISPSGFRSTTFDLADLFRFVKQEYPEQFEQLVSGELDPDDATFAELVRLEKQVQRFINEAQAEAGSNDDGEAWKVAYEQVFCDAVSSRIRTLFDTLHRRFDYYDPDTTYQEDVRAYANALHDRVEELKEHYPAVG